MLLRRSKRIAEKFIVPDVEKSMIREVYGDIRLRCAFTPGATMKKFLVIIAGGILTVSAQATCYSVYNKSGKLIHQSADAPVDTRLQYHMTVPQRFGAGSTLVYVGNGENCSPIGVFVDAYSSEGTPGEMMTGQRLIRRKADRS